MYKKCDAFMQQQACLKAVLKTGGGPEISSGEGRGGNHETLGLRLSNLNLLFPENTPDSSAGGRIIFTFSISFHDRYCLNKLGKGPSFRFCASFSIGDVVKSDGSTSIALHYVPK